MIIENLHLESFKGFTNFDVPCSQFTALVGPNNGGKTSILQAVRLVHDIFRFAFGGRERPELENPRWDSNPETAIHRLGFADPDDVWLHKRTSEPCRISAEFSGNVGIRLEIQGPTRYALDVLRNGVSVKGELGQAENRAIIEQLFALRPAYVPAPGAISPTEDFLHYPQLEQKLIHGRTTECWRAQLYWLREDRVAEDFEKVVETVREYLPTATILPPRLTHDSPPRIRFEVEEEGTAFDISTSGGGLLTLLSLAFVLRLSDSRCLMLDEPDAHLHPSLQREVARMLIEHALEDDVQVFAATHAPDFIAELPLDSLVWVDRRKSEGAQCSEIGRVLVDLGAATKADAIRTCGADKMVFVEGSLDQKLLARVLSPAMENNPFDDPDVLVTTLRSGKGDRKHIPFFTEKLRDTLSIDTQVACITDRDWEVVEGTPDEEGRQLGVLFLSLPVKEVENLLLNEELLARAAAIAAEEQQQTSDVPPTPATAEDMRRLVDAALSRDSVRDTMETQLISRWFESRGHDQLTPELLAQAKTFFHTEWDEREWRLNNCPGKDVLADVKRRCQEEFHLTLTDRVLIQAATEPVAEVAELARSLERLFYGDPPENA